MIVPLSPTRWLCLFGLCLGLLGCQESPSIPTAEDTQGDTLRYRWTNGQILHYRFDLSQDIEIQTPVETIQNFTRISQFYRLKPLSSRDGLQIKMEFDDVVASMKEGDNEASYDSRASNPEDSYLAQLLAGSFGKSQGQSITLHLNSNLKIQQIVGLTALLERMSETVQPNLRAMIYSIFDEDRVKQLVYLTPLPQGEIVEGYAWPIQETRGFGLLGQTKLDGIAKFARQEKRNDQNLFQIKLSGNARTAAQGNDQQPFTLNSGSFEGMAWFNPKLGHYADGILTYRLDVRPTKTTLTQSASPEKIKVTQKYAVKLDRIETDSKD